jgi:hypothetical protein
VLVAGPIASKPLRTSVARRAVSESWGSKRAAGLTRRFSRADAALPRLAERRGDPAGRGGDTEELRCAPPLLTGPGARYRLAQLRSSTRLQASTTSWSAALRLGHQEDVAYLKIIRQRGRNQNKRR